MNYIIFSEGSGIEKIVLHEAFLRICLDTSTDAKIVVHCKFRPTFLFAANKSRAINRDL